MKLPVYSKSGEKQIDMAMPSAFDVTATPKLITMYANYLRAALKSRVAHAKDRSEVSGGGRKPWRQKGTGNARVGSSRSPLWVGGGVTFGPSDDRTFATRMNKNTRRKAILGLFNHLISDKKVSVIENLEFDKPSTKQAKEVIEKLGLEGKIAVIYPQTDENVWLSFRNLAGVKIMSPEKLDFFFLLSADKVAIAKDAVNTLAKQYTEGGKKGAENE